MHLEGTSFLYGANSAFIEELYQRFLKDPSSVEPSWRAFFGELGDDPGTLEAERRGASWAPRNGHGPDLDGFGPALDAVAPQLAPSLVGAPAAQVRQATLDSLRALMLIRSYRVRGHLRANLDPLGLTKIKEHPELDPRTYGFREADWDRPIFLNHVLGLETATLREIMEVLNRTYCGSVGVEFMHHQGPEEKAWLQQHIEGRFSVARYGAPEKHRILQELTEAEGFERFLHLKYTGTKRFGLEGAESLIPAMETLVRRGAELGVREISLGMAHRGRLNVLANFMGKPFQAIFSEFQGMSAHPQDVQGSGDVKYHLGTSTDRDFGGHGVHLSLSANPSHLEASDPVVLGKVRAKQTQIGDVERRQVMAVLLHGDAAFAGQGLVAECFALSDLKGYRTGGTVHIIINNQIGFTTNPTASRSSPYCSDVAKMVQAPVLHVNGDDPEAVCHVAELAAEYRQRFKQDFVIDMFCYRRHGHNEADEPAFTQPIMYRKIAEHPTTRAIFASRLAQEGVVPAEESEAMVADFHKRLEQDYEAAAAYKPNKADWLDGVWSGMERAKGEARRGDTDVDLKSLKEIGRKLTEIPEGFNAHRTIRRLLEAKRKMIETGEGIDWATAEALAFGALLEDGFPVRLSGQDSARGTFSQRHAELIDQVDERTCTPLNRLSRDQARFEVINSPLSEAAVLGFEYGYTLAEPRALVLWEAQFGDFANGAQVIVDQFISSAETKWLRMSGLVMLLPHGFEGQGPEHSSARLERYLQLCAEDNIQVANCSTPASYFHILRRQMHRKFRKPLILMTPKSLLRHKRCVSRLEDMGPGTSFHRLLPDEAEGGDQLQPPEEARRVVLCSGKVYYDLLEAREQLKRRRVYLMRLEQLYPFPKQTLARELARFPNAEVVWCQEEPKNMGAWGFVESRIEAALKKIGHKHPRPRYVGRPESASTATGFLKVHQREQEELVQAALAR